ncbi:MAG: hypothetical protein NTV87_12665, partial [Ignavibacteriae bacterium]|nr:hypothetical protein [Ignavibacteriota bacterium]
MKENNSNNEDKSIFQLMQDYVPHKLRIAEDNIPIQWNINDEYLGLYEIKEILGKGGMGIVHRVWHKIWKMDIAVKSPLEKIINTESGLESFIREANTW